MTFIDGALVGGNYDDYASEDDANIATNNQAVQDNDFQDIQVCSQQRIPTLSSVAKKIAQKEGKILIRSSTLPTKSSHVRFIPSH